LVVLGIIYNKIIGAQEGDTIRSFTRVSDSF